MAERDGGPAFPEPRSADNLGGAWDATPGMSLRDYFAAAALSGCMHRDLQFSDAAEVAAICCHYADAMLAERGKADTLRDAAHDLLAALEEAELGWSNVLEMELVPRQHEMSVKVLRDNARAAIAKAKGGEG